MQPTENYYRLLGIEENATTEQIKKAYRKKALLYHPDLNAEEGAEDQCKNINQAYAVLSDPEQRRMYDLYGEVPRAQRYQPPAQEGRRCEGCRGQGRGMGRGCGGMGIWQEILRKR